MTNIDEMTEMIRTGDMDFLLLKPIDTQFLVSLKRIEWSSAGNCLLGVCFLLYSLAYWNTPRASCRSCFFWSFWPAAWRSPTA